VILSEVVAGLASPDPEERRRATAMLSGSSGERAVRLLLQALGDSDWRVRKEATGVAVSRAPVAEVLRALVETFYPGEDNVGLRNAAVEALGEFGGPAVDALSVALGDLDADGRKLAAEALGRTGEVAALLVLRTLMGDEDPNVSAAAIEAVAALGPTCVDDAAPLLTARLDAADSFHRLTALNGLNQLGVVLSWDRIQRLLEDPILEPAALTAAGLAAPPEAAPMLVRALSHARRPVRAAAQMALVDFVRASESALLAAKRALAEVPEAIREHLLSVAAEPSDSLSDRRAALVLVGALQTEQAAEVAADALSDEQMADEAEEALVNLGLVARGPLIARIRRGGGSETAAAIDLLGRLADPSCPQLAVSAILPTLTDASPDVVEAALIALARLGDDSALRPAARRLHSDVARIRRVAATAVAAIARRNPDSARELVRRATAHGSDALAAVVITGALPPPVRPTVDEDVRFLSDALSADSTLVRRAALDALAGLRSTLAADAVAFALTDEELEVRRAAVRALGAMRAADGSAPGIEYLLELIRRGADDDLVVSSIKALGAARDPRALDVLQPLVRRGDPRIAVHAVEALARIDDPRRLEVLSEALTNSDVEVVKAALQTLVDDAGAGARQKLVDCLEHAAWDVRRLAADLLGRVGGHGAMAQLRTRLKVEREPLVREALQRALITLESADVVLRRTTPPPIRER